MFLFISSELNRNLFGCPLQLPPIKIHLHSDVAFIKTKVWESAFHVSCPNFTEQHFTDKPPHFLPKAWDFPAVGRHYISHPPTLPAAACPTKRSHAHTLHYFFTKKPTHPTQADEKHRTHRVFRVQDDSRKTCTPCRIILHLAPFLHHSTGKMTHHFAKFVTERY